MALDSSVVAKWALPEDDSALARRVIDDTTAGGGRVIVLELALVEATNAIITRWRRGLASAVEARAAYQLLQGCPVSVHESLPLSPRAFEIALRHRVAIYDALFVALAERVGGGVTADVKLHAAVQADFPAIKLLRDWAPAPPG